MLVFKTSQNVFYQLADWWFFSFFIPFFEEEKMRNHNVFLYLSFQRHCKLICHFAVSSFFFLCVNVTYSAFALENWWNYTDLHENLPLNENTHFLCFLVCRTRICGKIVYYALRSKSECFWRARRFAERDILKCFKTHSTFTVRWITRAITTADYT